MWFFHFAFLCGLNLTSTVNLALLLKVSLFLPSAIWCLSTFLSYIITCTLKLIYNTFSVLFSPHLWNYCKYLIMIIVCIDVHLSVNHSCVCFYQLVFYFHIPNHSTESCIAGLVDQRSSWSFTNPFEKKPENVVTCIAHCS